MAENLIYGKTVFDFGAVGDGKADDTAAFEKAFESSESLICIPYGHYTVKKELHIKSGVRINCHPRAIIDFAGITAEEKSYKTIIKGGIWNCNHKENCAFDFTDSAFCSIENAEISSKSDCVIGLCGGKNTNIENVKISSAGTSGGIIMGGDVSFIRLKNISFSGCESAIELASGCYAYGMTTDGICFDNCAVGFFAKNFILANSVISGISGNTNCDTLHFEGGEITDSVFKDISVYDGYIYIEGTKMFSLEIDGFRRLADKEITPLKPSLTVKECPECTLICDGIPLDAVIMSKKSVPDIKMTAAKIASPYPTVYNYTTELPLDRNHTYVIPVGGFESLTIFSEKD